MKRTITYENNIKYELHSNCDKLFVILTITKGIISSSLGVYNMSTIPLYWERRTIRYLVGGVSSFSANNAITYILVGLLLHQLATYCTRSYCQSRMTIAECNPNKCQSNIHYEKYDI